MSGQIKRFKETKDRLDKVSGSFCLAKWLQVTLHLQNGHNHSCHHPMTHFTPVDEIKENPSALHNTGYKKKQRKKMLEGERPAECQYCWNVEDLPGDHLSDRVIKSSDPWAVDKMEEIAVLSPDANINPTYVEVSFSNACNFKCSYCSPVHSSRWVQEIEQHGPYPTSGNHNNLEWFKQNNQMPIHHKEHNPYVEAFWEWWPELVKTLRVFRITGGEPLMDPNTIKVLEHLDKNPNPDLELSINTNGCVPDKLFVPFLDKIKKITNEGKIKRTRIYTSVDAAGRQAEYGRTGLDYEKWKSNVDKILTESPLTKITVMCTSNIFSITNFGPLLEFILEMKKKHYHEARKVPITLDMSILRWPKHQCAAILPPEYSAFMDFNLKFMKHNQESENGNPPYTGFFDFEIAKMERFIEFINSGSTEGRDNLPQYRADFYTFVNEHDKRRGTNFLETFPELTEFYEMCRKEKNA